MNFLEQTKLHYFQVYAKHASSCFIVDVKVSFLLLHIDKLKRAECKAGENTFLQGKRTTSTVTAYQKKIGMRNDVAIINIA